MFRTKKRVTRVEISFKHGDCEIKKEIIVLLPGQTFTKGIGADTVWEGQTIVRQYSWKAGYTVVIEYFYIEADAGSNAGTDC